MKLIKYKKKKKHLPAIFFFIVYNTYTYTCLHIYIPFNPHKHR